MLPQGMRRAARAVGVALLLADVHHQPRVERPAEDGIGQRQRKPIRMLAGDGVIAEQDLRLHRAGQVHQMRAASLRAWRRGMRGHGGLRRVPIGEDALNLLQHPLRRKIAGHHQQRVGRRVVSAVEALQSLAGVGRHLLFAGRDAGIRMRAEQRLAQPLAGQKTRRGALDAQRFHLVPPLALQLGRRERRVARQIAHQRQQFRGKLRQPAETDGAGIGAGAGAQIGAQTPQLLFNLAARARGGAGAHHGRGHIRQTGHLARGIAAAEQQLPAELGNGVRLDQHHLQAIGQRAHRARRPHYRALRSERGRGHAGAQVPLRSCRDHHAPPVCAAAALRARITIARFAGTKYFCAAARVCSGVTARNPSSMVLTRVGSPSNSVKQAA